MVKYSKGIIPAKSTWHDICSSYLCTVQCVQYSYDRKGSKIMTNSQTNLQAPYAKPEVTSLTEAEVLGSIEAWGISVQVPD